MDNPVKGEISLTVGTETYKLVLTTNACAVVENATNCGVDVMMQNYGRLSFQRAMLCACMLKHHPDMTLEKAGDIIDEAGTKACAAAVLEAFNRAFKKSQEAPSKKNG